MDENLNEPRSDSETISFNVDGLGMKGTKKQMKKLLPMKRAK